MHAQSQEVDLRSERFGGVQVVRQQNPHISKYLKVEEEKTRSKCQFMKEKQTYKKKQRLRVVEACERRCLRRKAHDPRQMQNQTNKASKRNSEVSATEE